MALAQEGRCSCAWRLESRRGLQHQGRVSAWGTRQGVEASAEDCQKLKTQGSQSVARQETANRRKEAREGV